MSSWDEDALLGISGSNRDTDNKSVIFTNVITVNNTKTFQLPQRSLLKHLDGVPLRKGVWPPSFTLQRSHCCKCEEEKDDDEETWDAALFAFQLVMFITPMSFVHLFRNQVPYQLVSDNISNTSIFDDNRTFRFHRLLVHGELGS